MKMTFGLKNNCKILEFQLDNDSITNLIVYHEWLANGVLRTKKHDSFKSIDLLNLLRYHLGGNGNLDEYIKHIKENGFYSPYQPNLVINISDG